MKSKKFNTAGRIHVSEHYHVPLLQRINLTEVLGLINENQYFGLHAPRQTGKTSTLYALRDILNSGSRGAYRCVVVNVESAQVAGEDVARTVRILIDAIGFRAHDTLGDSFVLNQKKAVLAAAEPEIALTRTLSAWAKNDTRPLVLILDEIDTLVGESLVSVLRQIRTGYEDRPTGFPKSVILCGIHDVRDYRIKTKDKQAPVMGGSAFNISVASLRLRDFLKEEVFSLLEQHTDATGQTFEQDAKDYIWAQTNGQPWLVNRLARGCIVNTVDVRSPISHADVVTAREEMILARVTHLDQLGSRLEESRVRRVVEPILAGSEKLDGTQSDIEYARDLSLLAVDAPVRIANPIYTEIIPRVLTTSVQDTIKNEYLWYIKEDKSLDVMALMQDFQKFFQSNSESCSQLYDYKESGPHLLLQAFMQRVINGGGRIEREYALGNFRTDLLVIWPVSETIEEKFVIERKIKRKSKENTIDEGSRQVSKYMDRCGAQQAHLVLFDRDSKKSWTQKLYCEQHTYNGLNIFVWGC